MAESRGISRRQFLIDAGVLGLGLGVFGVSSCSKRPEAPQNQSASIVARESFSKQSYEQLAQELQKSGYEIDVEHSVWISDSKTCVTFLPDIHVPEYQAPQRERIVAIDKAIPFDAIGLEGLVGAIDAKQIRQSCDETCKRFKQELFEWSIYPDQADTRVQFANVPLRLAEFEQADLAFLGTPFMKEVLSNVPDDYVGNPQDAYGWHFQLMKEKGEMLMQLPCKTVLEWTPLLRADRKHPFIEAIETLFDPSPAIRTTAPGRAYADLLTRAQKIGVEKAENDGLAMAVMSLSVIDEGSQELKEHCKRFKGAYSRFVATCEGKLTPDEQQKLVTLGESIDQYVSSVHGLLPSLNPAREKLLARIGAADPELAMSLANPELIKQAAWDQARDRFIIDERSQQWIDSCSPYKSVMLIGGSGHTQSVYDAARTKKQSIITLKEIKVE